VINRMGSFRGKEERGQGMVEYALLIVLLVLVVIVLIQVMGTAVSNMYSHIVAGFEPLIP
jgi:pilus assembly protein Flp/PilA